MPALAWRYADYFLLPLLPYYAYGAILLRYALLRYDIITDDYVDYIIIDADDIFLFTEIEQGTALAMPLARYALLLRRRFSRAMPAAYITLEALPRLL